MPPKRRTRKSRRVRRIRRPKGRSVYETMTNSERSAASSKISETIKKLLDLQAARPTQSGSTGSSGSSGSSASSSGGGGGASGAAGAAGPAGAPGAPGAAGPAGPPGAPAPPGPPAPFIMPPWFPPERKRQHRPQGGDDDPDDYPDEPRPKTRPRRTRRHDASKIDSEPEYVQLPRGPPAPPGGGIAERLPAADVQMSAARDPVYAVPYQNPKPPDTDDSGQKVALLIDSRLEAAEREALRRLSSTERDFEQRLKALKTEIEMQAAALAMTTDQKTGSQVKVLQAELQKQEHEKSKLDQRLRDIAAATDFQMEALRRKNQESEARAQDLIQQIKALDQALKSTKQLTSEDVKKVASTLIATEVAKGTSMSAEQEKKIMDAIMQKATQAFAAKQSGEQLKKEMQAVIANEISTLAQTGTQTTQQAQMQMKLLEQKNNASADEVLSLKVLIQKLQDNAKKLMENAARNEETSAEKLKEVYQTESNLASEIQRLQQALQESHRLSQGQGQLNTKVQEQMNAYGAQLAAFQHKQIDVDAEKTDLIKQIEQWKAMRKTAKQNQKVHEQQIAELASLESQQREKNKKLQAEIEQQLKNTAMLNAALHEQLSKGKKSTEELEQMLAAAKKAAEDAQKEAKKLADAAAVSAAAAAEAEKAKQSQLLGPPSGVPPGSEQPPYSVAYPHPPVAGDAGGGVVGPPVMLGPAGAGGSGPAGGGGAVVLPGSAAAMDAARVRQKEGYQQSVDAPGIANSLRTLEVENDAMMRSGVERSLEGPIQLGAAGPGGGGPADGGGVVALIPSALRQAQKEGFQQSADPSAIDFAEGLTVEKSMLEHYTPEAIERMRQQHEQQQMLRIQNLASAKQKQFELDAALDAARRNAQDAHIGQKQKTGRRTVAPLLDPVERTYEDSELLEQLRPETQHQTRQITYSQPSQDIRRGTSDGPPQRLPPHRPPPRHVVTAPPLPAQSQNPGEETKKSTKGFGKRSLNKDGLSDDELMKLAKEAGPHVAKVVRGAYAKDELQSINLPKDKPTGLIVNTDPSTRGGEHWVAVYIDPRPNTASVEYYDSLGHDPSKSMTDSISRMTKANFGSLPYLLKFKVNSVKQQHASSPNCGFFALKFLINRIRGQNFETASGFKKIRTSQVAKGEKNVAIMKRKFGYM